MKILHVVPGLEEVGNGIAVAAKLIAAEQRASSATTPGQGRVELVETREFVFSTSTSSLHLSSYDEIWVHSNWWWPTIRACWKVIRAGKPLVRMTHANLDPKRMWSKGWKKLPIWWLIERRLMNRAARVVVTCEAEREWCERAGVKGPFEIVDLKRFFDLDRIIHLGRNRRTCEGRTEGEGIAEAKLSAETKIYNSQTPHPLHVLYLGRPHPLKGVKYLELAIADINYYAMSRLPNCPKGGVIELRVVSNARGAELEEVWEWCDVLCLPTLSDNFGLVVAEALERGKQVITTDGAPAWAPEVAGSRVEGVGEEWRERLFYIDGYRDGSEKERVNLLKDALKYFV